MDGPEREWWLKFIISEFKNFLTRDAWKCVSLSEVKAKGKKIIPTKLVFKKKDEIDRTIRFKMRAGTG